MSTKSNECELCRYASIIYYTYVLKSKAVSDLVAAVIKRIGYNLNECKSLELRIIKIFNNYVKVDISNYESVDKTSFTLK
jgi:hypothetical protein